MKEILDVQGTVSHHYRFSNADTVVAVALGHGVCSSSDPLTSEKRRLTCTIDSSALDDS